MAQVLSPYLERTSVRTMPWLSSENSSTKPKMGLVKLGQPQPDSYLSDDANNGSPETMSA